MIQDNESALLAEGWILVETKDMNDTNGKFQDMLFKEYTLHLASNVFIDLVFSYELNAAGDQIKELDPPSVSLMLDNNNTSAIPITTAEQLRELVQCLTKIYTNENKQPAN